MVLLHSVQQKNHWKILSNHVSLPHQSLAETGCSHHLLKGNVHLWMITQTAVFFFFLCTRKSGKWSEMGWQILKALLDRSVKCRGILLFQDLLTLLGGKTGHRCSHQGHVFTVKRIHFPCLIFMLKAPWQEHWPNVGLVGCSHLWKGCRREPCEPPWHN